MARNKAMQTPISRRPVSRRRVLSATTAYSLLTGVSPAIWSLHPARAEGAAGTFTDGIAISGGHFTASEADYLLADILPPRLSSPEAAPACRLVQSYLDNGAVFHDTMPLDRWGRRVGRLVRAETPRSADATSVHDAALALVEKGLAIVMPQTEDVDGLYALLAAEDRARAEGAGLWSRDDAPIYDAADFVPYHGYRLIEGKIRSAAERRTRLFLNFGEDYRTDATASAPRRLMRQWSKRYADDSRSFWSHIGEDVEAIVGYDVVVRGYVAALNGPSVALSHPMQITFKHRTG
ncbi:MAG: thermonuclease family protein [Pseudomonadota bacterium]